jgi:hypothetical protein
VSCAPALAPLTGQQYGMNAYDPATGQRVVKEWQPNEGELAHYAPPAPAVSRTERAAAVRRPASVLVRRRNELFVVDEVDTGRMRLSGRLWGRRRSFAVHLLPPALRRIAVTDGGRGLEPMALFVGRGGRMLSKQRWEQIFTAGVRPCLAHRRW